MAQSNPLYLRASRGNNDKPLRVDTDNSTSQRRFTRNMMVKHEVAKRVNYINAIQHLHVLVFLINDEAGFAIFDAVQALKKSSLYKHKAKFLANRVLKGYDAYERSRRDDFLNKDVETLNYHLYDAFHDNAQKYVWQFRMAVLNVLTRLQVKERDALSYVVTAEGLLILARDVFQAEIEAKKHKYGVDISREMAKFSLAGLYRTWNNLVSSLLSIDIQEAICKDKDFCLAIEIITKRLTDINTLEILAGDVLRDHKDEFIAASPNEEIRQEVETQLNDFLNNSAL